MIKVRQFAAKGPSFGSLKMTKLIWYSKITNGTTITFNKKVKGWIMKY